MTALIRRRNEGSIIAGRLRNRPQRKWRFYWAPSFLEWHICTRLPLALRFEERDSLFGRIRFVWSSTSRWRLIYKEIQRSRSVVRSSKKACLFRDQIAYTKTTLNKETFERVAALRRVRWNRTQYSSSCVDQSFYGGLFRFSFSLSLSSSLWPLSFVHPALTDILHACSIRASLRFPEAPTNFGALQRFSRRWSARRRTNR